MTYKAPKKRKNILHGRTILEMTGCGKLFVTINEDDGNIYEVFGKLGKSGSCFGSLAEGLGRMITLAFRLGADPEQVVKQLKGIRCPMPYVLEKDSPENSLSCCDAFGKAIESYIAHMKEAKK